MSQPPEIRDIIEARLNIATAKSTIKTAQFTMSFNQQEQAAKVWAAAKAGHEPLFLTSGVAKEVVKLAAAEVGQVNCTAPPSDKLAAALANGPQNVAPIKTAHTPVLDKLAGKTSPPVAATKPSPAPVQAPGTITAEQFVKPAMTMTRDEFSKLPHMERGKFFQQGGKLVD